MEGDFTREDENTVDKAKYKRSCQVRGVKNPITCEIDFDGPLTSEAYSKLVAETIKYVLYSRGQLPLQCDYLFKLYLTDPKDTEAGGDIKNGEHFCSKVPVKPNSQARKMKQTVENIKELLDQIEDLFVRNETCEIQEFLIIIGATPVSPKNTYNIKFPRYSCRTNSTTCLIRRCLVQMFRKLVMMEELSGIPSICPTNSYIFVKMRRMASDKWFVPKPDFRPLVSRGLWVLFIFRVNTETCRTLESVDLKDQEMSAIAAANACETEAFEIFSEPEMRPDCVEGVLPNITDDNCMSPTKLKDSLNAAVDNLAKDFQQVKFVEEALEPGCCDDDEPFIWFQAPVVIKGANSGAALESGTDWM